MTDGEPVVALYVEAGCITLDSYVSLSKCGAHVNATIRNYVVSLTTSYQCTRPNDSIVLPNYYPTVPPTPYPSLAPTPIITGFYKQRYFTSSSCLPSEMYFGQAVALQTCFLVRYPEYMRWMSPFGTKMNSTAYMSVSVTSVDDTYISSRYSLYWDSGCVNELLNSRVQDTYYRSCNEWQTSSEAEAVSVVNASSFSAVDGVMAT